MSSPVRCAPLVWIAGIAAFASFACEPKPAPPAEATASTTAPPVASASALAVPVDGAAPASSASSCKDMAQAARARLQPVLDRSRACTADSDCVVVPVSTRCFDMCTRAVAASQKSNVQSALADSDTACEGFVQAGCKRIVPPCLPPPPTVCREGKCSQ
jgi:hypothetical protein